MGSLRWRAGRGSARYNGRLIVTEQSGTDAASVRRRGVGAARRRRQSNVAGGRTRTRQVKLTEAEDAKLIARAERAGMSVPRWLAEAGMSADVGVTREERREMLAELMGLERLLANVANNVNQIAAGVNATGRTEHDLSAVAEACKRAVGRTGAAVETVAKW